MAVVRQKDHTNKQGDIVKYTTFAITTDTTTAVIAGVKGAFIRILGALFLADAAVTVTFKTNGGASIIPATVLAAGAKIGLIASDSIVSSAAGSGLDIVTTGIAGNLTGFISYTEIPADGASNTYIK